jgi:hypothetical protein
MRSATIAMTQPTTISQPTQVRIMTVCVCNNGALARAPEFTRSPTVIRDNRIR